MNVASATILVMAAQGMLGYVQYFERIPAVLVGFHVFGAVCVFTCVQLLVLEMWVVDDRVPVPTDDAAVPRDVAVVQ